MLAFAGSYNIPQIGSPPMPVPFSLRSSRNSCLCKNSVAKRSAMRVLTFLHSFEPGGVERVALRLVRQWRELGIEAPLFLGRDEGELGLELANGLDYAVARRGRWPANWIAKVETLWMIMRLPAEIRRTRPDVLFCAGNTYSVVVVFMKLMLGGSCPPVVAKISNDLVLPGMSGWLRLLYGRWAWLQSRLIEGWVIMHWSMRADVLATIGPVHMSIIPDPALTEAELDQFRQWAPPARAEPGRRFVAMGRLVEQKNYPLMLRAFAAGAGADDRLAIFGAGPCRAALERQAGALGIAAQVRFEGHVPGSAAFMVGQDVLLMSSHYEGIPAALVEALACGMPIISTDCGDGVRGLLADYNQGVLVAPGDGAELARAIATASATHPTKGAFDVTPFTIEVAGGAYHAVFAAVARRVGAADTQNVAALALASIALPGATDRDAA